MRWRVAYRVVITAALLATSTGLAAAQEKPAAAPEKPAAQGRPDDSMETLREKVRTDKTPGLEDHADRPLTLTLAAGARRAG